MAILAAMSSQFVDADAALLEAERLGADLAERRFLASILSHYRGDSAAAKRLLLGKQAARHGGLRQRADLEPDQVAAPAPDDELLAFHEALDRLAQQHPENAEVVKLWYFAGLTADQAAAALGLSPTTADRHWAYARAWLRRAMSAGPARS
jgi:DNA-directed RNA polymerase specialized sigma24 family protein